MISNPSFFVRLFTRCKIFFANLMHGKKTEQHNAHEILARLERLERNYIILLKRVLEIDGIQLMAKTRAYTNKVIATPSDEFNKGLNEPEPTIH